MEGDSDEDDDLEVRDKVANLMTKRKRNNDDRQDERRVRSISIWTETSGPACWWSEAPCSNICNENYETKIDTRCQCGGGRSLSSHFTAGCSCRLRCTAVHVGRRLVCREGGDD